MKTTPILITGAAGFIGSHFVDLLLSLEKEIVVLDALTYAGSLENLEKAQSQKNFTFIEGRIEDEKLIDQLFKDYNFSSVVNFAAESHVDRSIENPHSFIQTNIMGTYCLLNRSLKHWQNLPEPNKSSFRFIQVSTDEVFGDLELNDPKFNEETAYNPSSPYSASKASADHLVQAWHRTYGLPCIITNCSNNYGPRQYPEKLIPITIKRAINNEPIAVYGKGTNIRDWIHVKDHCDGISLALHKGRLGESYCFGGNYEITNIEIVQKICRFLDELKPRQDGLSYSKQITFVTDRLGHDFRYAIDDSKAKKELGYKQKYEFDHGLRETISWYLDFFTQKGV